MSLFAQKTIGRCAKCGTEVSINTLNTHPCLAVDVEELARKYIDSLPLQTHAARVHGGEGFLAGAALRLPLLELLGECRLVLLDAKLSLTFKEEDAWCQGSLELIDPMLAKLAKAMGE